MSFETAEILKRRAESFLKNAEDLLSKEVYDLSAFSIHQFSELYLKFLLYIYTGDYPKTHSIKKLLKDFGKVLEEEKEVMEFIEANISHLGALEAVYLTSRYIPVEFEKFEVESLLNFAKKMKEFLDELCSKRA